MHILCIYLFIQCINRLMLHYYYSCIYIYYYTITLYTHLYYVYYILHIYTRQHMSGDDSPLLKAAVKMVTGFYTGIIHIHIV